MYVSPPMSTTQRDLDMEFVQRAIRLTRYTMHQTGLLS